MTDCRHCGTTAYPGYRVCKKHLFRRKLRPVMRHRKRVTKHRIPPNYGYIYVIKNPSNGFYKIGLSENVEKRCGGLEVAHVIDLEIAAKFLVPLPQTIEPVVHEFFDEYRINREWFDLDQDAEWLQRLGALLLALK